MDIFLDISSQVENPRGQTDTWDNMERHMADPISGAELAAKDSLTVVGFH